MEFWISLFQCIADECLYGGGCIDKNSAVMLSRTYADKLSTLLTVNTKVTSWFFLLAPFNVFLL